MIDSEKSRSCIQSCVSRQAPEVPRVRRDGPRSGMPAGCGRGRAAFMASGPIKGLLYRLSGGGSLCSLAAKV